MKDLPEAMLYEIARAAEAARRAEWLAVAAALVNAGSAAVAGGRPKEGALCAAQSEILRRCGGDPTRVFGAMQAGVLLGSDELSELFRTQTAEAWALEGAGEHLAAAEAYGQAAATGSRLDLPGWMLGALKRRRADRLLHAGDRIAAWSGYDAAAERHRKAGDMVASGWVDVEQAHRACTIGEVDRGLSVASRLELERAARTDSHLRAELAIAKGRLWRARGDLRAAAAEAAAALDAAVDAEAPVSCYAAACLLAEVVEEGGDCAEAYATLEQVSEQLAGLIGAEMAMAWMRGEFERARIRWGDGAFEETRAAHARARRAILIPAIRRRQP